MIVTAEAGSRSSLGESFYEAVGAYLTAPRHHKATLRTAIQSLAVHFEAFLRTMVGTFVPDRDFVLTDREAGHRGALSQAGYITDFARGLFGLDAHLWESKPGYWADRSTEEACYGLTFRHQQRARHELGEYSLEELERLARSILASYLFAARWLVANSNVAAIIEARTAYVSQVALFSWPTIIAHQLSDVRVSSEDPDLRERLDGLQARARDLMDQAHDLAAALAKSDPAEVKALRSEAEALAYDYETLITELYVRAGGRELQHIE